MTSNSEDCEQQELFEQQLGDCSQQSTKLPSDYADITEQFKSAAKCLRLGELLQHQSFSLYDAMTAIEMMEPKMDSGMRLHREILHPEKSAGSQLMKLDNLTDAELLGVMDESLACLASWLDGESALQSVFINLYLHCVDKIKCLQLRTFCHGLLCLLQRTKDLITLANTTDEEDFNSMFYSFETATIEASDDERVTSALKEADDDVGRRVKSGQWPDSYRLVQHRLRLLRSLLLLLRQFHRLLLASGTADSAETSPVVSAASSASSLLSDSVDSNATTAAAVEALAEVRRQLEVASTACAAIAESLEAGQPAIGREDPRLSTYGVQGFEPLANLRQLPPSFPRCVRVFERPAGVEYLAKCLTHLRRFLSEITVAACPSYQQLYTRLAMSCGLGSDTPCLARCFLRLLYCCPVQQQHGFGLSLASARLFGRHSPVDFLLASLKQFAPAAAGIDWPASVRQLQGQPRQLADSLCLQLSRALLHQVCPLFSRNRSRKREKLASCLDCLWPLYESCYCLDRAIFPGDESRSLFLPYLTFYLFRLSRLYLLSGFSLQLYAKHELPAVYFMLGDGYLYYLLMGIIQADMAIQQQQQLNHPHYVKLNKQQMRHQQQIQQLYQHHLNMLRASTNLATATFYALCALHSDGKLRLANPHPAGETSAFKHRFQPLMQRPFLPLSINCCSSFKAAWNYRTATSEHHNAAASALPPSSANQKLPTTGDVYTEATREFERARDALATVANAATNGSTNNTTKIPAATYASIVIEDWDGDAFMKVAKTNMVVTKLLAAGHRSGPQYPAELDYSVSPHFPLIKLVQTAAAAETAAAAAPSASGSNGKC